MASSHNATMVAVNVTSSTSDSIKAYAAQSGEHFAVMILHKELKNTTALVNITLTVPTNQTQIPVATLHTLQGNVLSEFNVTLDGATYDGSVDGFPVGGGAVQRITGAPGGVYTFTIQPLSAALFILGDKETVIERKNKKVAFGMA